jgi:hypothetical protein
MNEVKIEPYSHISYISLGRGRNKQYTMNNKLYAMSGNNDHYEEH